jgi:hypothetical protein
MNKTDLENIQNYKINEKSVLSKDDIKHIENYKQLINFFENALTDSHRDGSTDYSSLHTSCLQCIRYLDSLINSYDTVVQSVRTLNTVIDKIVTDNTTADKESLGKKDDQETAL